MLETPRHSAALEARLRAEVRPSASGDRRRARRLVPAAIAVLAVTVAVSALQFSDLGGDTTSADATAFLLDGDTVAFDDFLDPGRRAALRRQFEGKGAQLTITEKPVAPSAAGTVLSVQYSTPDANVEEGALVVEPGVEVSVTVGVPSPEPTTEGASIYETLPDLCDLVEPKDAPATVQALREAGYRIQIKVITFRERGADARDADDAPPGSIVVSVLNIRGEGRSVKPRTKDLILEVSERGGHGHHGETDGACTAPTVPPPAAGSAPAPRAPGAQPGQPVDPLPNPPSQRGS